MNTVSGHSPHESNSIDSTWIATSAIDFRGQRERPCPQATQLLPTLLACSQQIHLSQDTESPCHAARGSPRLLPAALLRQTTKIKLSTRRVQHATIRHHQPDRSWPSSLGFSTVCKASATIASPSGLPGPAGGVRLWESAERAEYTPACSARSRVFPMETPLEISGAGKRQGQATERKTGSAALSRLCTRPFYTSSQERSIFAPIISIVGR